MSLYLSRFSKNVDEVFYQRSRILDYVQGQMINELPREESRVRAVSRQVLKGLGAGAIVAGNSAFIAINLELGGDNLPYGIALALGNALSFGGLGLWSLFNIINDCVDPISLQNGAQRSKKGQLIKVAILVASAGVSGISLVPLAYIAGESNPDGLKGFMAASVFASDLWFPLYSTYLSINKLVDLQRDTKFEKELIQTRKGILELLDDNREFLKADREHRMNYVGALEAIKECEAGPMKYLEGLLEKRGDEDKKLSLCSKVAEKGIFSGGLALAGSHMLFLGYLGFKATAVGWENIYGDLAAAGLVVATNSYLVGLSVPQTAVSVYNKFKEIILCRYQPSLSEQFALKMTFVLKALSLATVSLSYGPTVEIAREDFSGGLKYATQISVSLACALLVSTALLDITNQIVEGYVVRKGSEEEQQIVKMDRQLRDFKRVLEKSPLLEYAKLLKVLPAKLFNDLVDDTSITIDNLEGYISDHLDIESEGLLDAEAQQV